MLKAWIWVSCWHSSAAARINIFNSQIPFRSKVSGDRKELHEEALYINRSVQNA